MKRFRRRLFTLGLLLTIPTTVLGDDDAVQKFVTGKNPTLEPYFRKLYEDGEHNAVLNFDMLGLAALSLRDYRTAETAFDQAIVRIDGIVVEDPNAEKAKQYFNEEKIKDFKGEPYERAMTYYYRGLLYARTGDFQNARAAFLSAGLQAAKSTSETYERSFGTMNFLASWASNCDNDDVRAKDLRSAAEKEDASLSSVPAVSNTVLLFEVGSGPGKKGTGKYQELLTFVERSPIPSAKAAYIAAADDHNRILATVPLATIGDVYMQASTRGGRPIQGILDGKAQFKDTAGTVSQAGMTTAIVASSVASNPNIKSSYAAGAGIVGLVGLAVGLIASGVEKATTPAADIRYWPTLPRTILFGDLSSVAASGSVVGMVGDSDATGAAGTRVLVDQGSCTLLWGRDTSALADPETLKADKSSDRGNSDADARFRASLLEAF